ncbi:MAG: CDP-diacylglycerol--serine O-phosphatidyltransferase [Bdellovibrionota bacterium]
MREKLHGKVFLVPSSVTVVGIFCGFLAIISAIKLNFEYATKCIGLAIILDGIDGRVARRLNATSAFGKEFDSLSDLIAFGVAPAVLFYCWAFGASADEIGVLACFVYVVSAAARLARFNVETTGDPKSHFVGLPSPGAAAAIASVVYAYPAPVENDWAVGFLLIYMVVVGFMMVSTVPFFSVKKIKFTRDQQKVYLIALALFVALAWKYNRLVILLISVSYALSGLVSFLVRTGRASAGEDVQPKVPNASA